MDRKQYWEGIYSKKPADEVSWFQKHANRSLDLIHSTGLGKDAAIIDVGGGASTLVDDLVAEGYTDVTVLDLSVAALNVAKVRLGERERTVHWMSEDITRAAFRMHSLDIWHDRAVFHFLTDPSDRRAYVERVMWAVRPGGHVIIATFGENGPTMCSGLPVVRYNAGSLHDEFGGGFVLLKHEEEIHHTPAGKSQQFIYCYCRVAQS
jgi:2-polyprenyl-3-methyl-5-hydroxy-6-metoxy-1,4-benzoquinol methylase